MSEESADIGIRETSEGCNAIPKDLSDPVRPWNCQEPSLDVG